MAFESGFDVSEPTGPYRRFAEVMSMRWPTVTERDKSGKAKSFEMSINCNQEPCYEELIVQQIRGVASNKLRDEALRHRREMNGGFTPCSPDTVRRAVIQACEAVAAYRSTLPPIITADPVSLVTKAMP
jgi:hypothetical protein